MRAETASPAKVPLFGSAKSYREIHRNRELVGPNYLDCCRPATTQIDFVFGFAFGHPAISPWLVLLYRRET